jgi:hypothetical protein
MEFHVLKRSVTTGIHLVTFTIRKSCVMEFLRSMHMQCICRVRFNDVYDVCSYV